MGEQIAHTVSNLVPLLVVLLAIFGILIAASIWLRVRVRSTTGKKPVKRADTPLEMQAGDVITVLGKTFQVTGKTPLVLQTGAALWCGLKGESGPGRLVILNDLSEATYFPGQGEPPESEPFPQQIEREEGGYQCLGEPCSLGQGWKLARYQGPGGRWLALEVQDQTTTLWRGKSIPVEGITVLQEK